jgi:uncharacterized membrane protein
MDKKITKMKRLLVNFFRFAEGRRDKILQVPFVKRVSTLADKTEIGRRTKKILQIKIVSVITLIISLLVAILCIFPGTFAGSYILQIMLIAIGVTIGISLEWLRQQFKQFKKRQP